MKCSNCGAELSDDAIFCSNCGYKIETITPMPVMGETEITPAFKNEVEVTPIPCDESVRETSKADDVSASLTGKLKKKISDKWHGLSIYGKIVIISIAVFLLLFLVALLFGKKAAAIIAIVQIVLAVVSILMHNGVIKLEQKKLWLKWLVLAIAILFTFLNIMSYSWGQSNQEDTSNRSDADSEAPVTEEISEVAATPYSADECVGQEYSAVKSAFSAAGFTNVKIEKIEDLAASDTDKLNTIESVSVGGKTDFICGQEFMSDDEVIICYHVYAKCNVTIHVDFVSNLMFSKYDVNFLLDNVKQGTMLHGEDQDFELTVDPGEYTLRFENTESSSVKGEVTLTVDCDIDVSYKISCYSDEISVETIYVDRLIELADDEVKLDVAVSEYEYKNYEEVTNALKTLGFTNIRYEILYDIVFGLTEEGEVDSVSIDGRTDCKKGEVFKQDVLVVITYHMNEEDDPNNKTGSDEEDVSSISEYEQTYADMEEMVTNQSYVYVRDLMKDMGYTAKYEHENTHLDYTGELTYWTDDELNAAGYIVTGIKELNIENKTITLYVNTTENQDRLEEQEQQQKSLEESFSPSVALSAMEQYGESQYPYGFEINMLTGRLAETAIDENTWFMKYTCTVTNSNGTKVEMTCEAKIKGPENSPVVYDFCVY